MDRTVVISLARRADRLDQFLSQPSLAMGWPLPAPVVYPAVDGPANGQNGMWGCRQSHLEVWAQALAQDVDTLWVFEDDAVLDIEFTWRLSGLLAAVPSDWEALMIGGTHLHDPEPVHYGVVRCTQAVQTHAYALRRDALYPAIRAVGNNPSMWFDHVFAGFLGPRRRTYAPNPWMVSQSGSPSDCGH